MDLKNQNNSDLLDILFDSDNTAPLIFKDEDGKELSFEQVAVIPYTSPEDDESAVYAILKPLDYIEGIQDDEAIVFKVIQDEFGDSALKIEENENIAREVYAEYIKLYEEETENYY